MLRDHGASPRARHSLHPRRPSCPPRFNLGTFSIGGTDVPNLKVVYGTYGHLNPKKDNAILLPSHYMADHHGYEWLIGPGLALDTTRYFLVATELFGNGHSSSPSNTHRPFDGPRFPVATIRDNVEAVHRLLLEDVGVTHLKAIIGFSMGAEQAFQWAVSYPDFADCIVATAGTARAWPHGIVRLEAEIGAITQDPGFHDGDYAEQPANGINQVSRPIRRANLVCFEQQHIRGVDVSVAGASLPARSPAATFWRTTIRVHGFKCQS